MIHHVLAGILAFSAGTAVADVPKDCPSSPAGWQDYRTQVAQTLVQFGGIDPARTVYKTVDGCVGKAEGGAQPQAKACMQRVLDLLSGDAVQGNTLGFNVPD